MIEILTNYITALLIIGLVGMSAIFWGGDVMNEKHETLAGIVAALGMICFSIGFLFLLVIIRH